VNRPRGESWPTVVCLGEVLIDLVAVDAGVPVGAATTFHRAAGGAPANVAVALARLGTDVGFIGKVGDDAFGRSLRETLAAESVDVRGLLEAPTARTALAFVGSDGQSGRSFVFYHDGTAHTLLGPEEVDRDLIGHARIFHFGSVTLAAEPSRAATRAAAFWAHQQACLVSFDPNVRLELWASSHLARTTIEDVLGMVDVVKVSSEELEFLTGTADLEDACGALRQRGPALAMVTLGNDGCFYQTATASGRVAGVPVECLDTLGAGDAFMAGVLACLAVDADGTILHDESALVHTLRFANAVGALTTTQYGAIPALPTRGQVESLLAPPHPAGRT
jgi:fructokinase